MIAQVYFVPGQTEGRRKAFLQWKSLSYELSLTCGGNFNYYISVHHPIPTRENREHPDNFQNKSVSSAFCWLPRYILFLTKPKRARREATLKDYPQEQLVVKRGEKVSTFVKLEKSYPSFVFN